ncbi:hypothetical protein CLV63_10396 [Murinocardiopsis flavida]|uniref:Uncharacterized protein n=1 Tax=Murinocardiopsis flavida TaxID=645275 RepID=A0A2P8DQ77_9ACTN|nr:hypothetical protein [Murinocardiopsis flavida]PSK99373.1 hypothetical protein CLV63_10396 [Murinocardiopsis flavida]
MRLMAPAKHEIDAEFLALVEELSVRALDTVAPATARLSPTSEPPAEDGEGDSGADDAPAEKPEKDD